MANLNKSERHNSSTELFEYPKFKSINELPYIQSLQMRLIYAKNFNPNKVGYYEALIKELKDNISNDSMKELLKNNGYRVSIGNHGLIFVTPSNGTFKKEFDNIKEAYNYYLSTNNTH